MKTSEAGFTLVEMLVVLAILAVASAAATLSLRPSVETRAAEAAAASIRAELTQARVAAIAGGAPARVVFDAGERSVAREGTAPVVLPKSVTLSLVTAREAGAENGAAIAFLPDGRSTGGRVEISSGAARRVVAVDWLTGLIRDAEP